MTRTREKLEEALFFLEKVDEHYFDHVRGMVEEAKPRHVFSYYFSAFVSAARSVTWVMRYEYGRLAGWEKWFATQKPAEDERGLLVLFNDLRVRSEKKEPVQLGHAFQFVGDPDAPERDPRMPKLRVTMQADDKVVQSGELAAMVWTSDEFDGQDLLPPCRQYVGMLSALVEECERKFAITAR